MSNNPLFTRLTQNSKWPTLRLCLWLAGGLAAVGMILSINGLLALPSVEARATQAWQDQQAEDQGSIYRSTEYGEMLSTSYLLMQLLWPALALLFLGPLVTGNMTVTQTSRDLHLEANSLASLAKTQIVEGYVYAGLHRARLLLALTVGLVPGLMGGFLNGALRLQILGITLGSASYITEPYRLNFLDIIGLSALLTISTAGLLALNPLAAALGAALSLRWRRTGTATYVTIAITLLGVLSGIVILLTIIGPAASGKAFSLSPTAIREIWITSGLCLVPPALITLGALALARYSVRRR